MERPDTESACRCRSWLKDHVEREHGSREVIAEEVPPSVEPLLADARRTEEANDE